MNDATGVTIVVSANFTAEPVEGSLRYWLRELQIPASVQHAPFDQVFQQLLDPASTLRSNRDGIGVLLVRLQSWLDQGSMPDTTPERIAQDLVAAVSEALGGSASQLVICFCPATGLDAERHEQLAGAEDTVADALREHGAVRVLTSASVLRLYPCEKIADEHGARIASMPYTPQFFSVLGTMLARSIYGLTFPAHKVLVLDCDDTLWGGLCSELGPQGVELSEEYLALQRFAAEQRRDGKLICLASRNNEADVFAVFDQNASMILTRDDLTAWQINWGLKSDSLAELASKLGLGLNSFVFLDDDPVQCAEVRRRFPAVLALQVPKSGVAEYCRHIWPLDRRSGTAEGSRRTGSYREHVAREDVRASSQSFQQFLDSLELNIDIAPLQEQDLARATELTYRTNQFNLTGRRVNEAEFRNLVLHESAPCFGVRVRDRFGDYGLVGLVLAESSGTEMRVPIMLLSCRSLGRGVEYRMVAHLGALAREHGAERVLLHAVPTERNDPAREFLHKLGEAHNDADTDADGTLHLALTTQQAEAVQLNLDTTPQPQEAPLSGARDEVRVDNDEADQRVAFMATIPAALATSEAIHEAIQSAVHGKAGVAATGDTPAGDSTDADPVETLLTRTFAEQLGLTEIPVDAGFFDLGGHSLQAMQILAQVSSAFGVELDPTLLFTTNFTIGELVEEINFLRDGDELQSPGATPRLSANPNR